MFFLNVVNFYHGCVLFYFNRCQQTHLLTNNTPIHTTTTPYVTPNGQSVSLGVVRRTVKANRREVKVNWEEVSVKRVKVKILCSRSHLCDGTSSLYVEITCKRSVKTFAKRLARKTLVGDALVGCRVDTGCDVCSDRKWCVCVGRHCLMQST